MKIYNFIQGHVSIRFHWIIIALGLLLFCVPNESMAQTGAKIKKIYFIGNKTISDKKLRKQLESHRSSRVSQLVTGKKDYFYDEKAFADELNFLKEYYQRQGFIDISIGRPKIDYDEKKDQVKITIPISEGRPIMVRSVSFNFPTIDDPEQKPLFKELNRRRSRMDLRKEKRFVDDNLIVFQDTIRIVLANHGYPYSTPEYGLSVDTIAHKVDVVWNIDAGPLSYFDTLSIEGNSRVGSKLIAEMAAFKRGQRYKMKLVDQTQKQIYGLGLFQVATVHPVFTENKDPQIPVQIVVKEQQRYRFKTGVGYGREERFRAYVDMMRYGFLGQNRTLRLFVKHSALEPYNIRTTFTQPAFLNPKNTLALTPYVWRQDEKAFSVRRIGGQVGIIRAFNPQLSGAANYIFENVKLVSDTLVPDLILKGKAITSYRKSSIVLLEQFDNSMPLFTPARGFFISSAATFNGMGIGQFPFFKLAGEIRHYRKYFGVVLATRAQAGGIMRTGSSQFVPYEERLFAGGANSVRGWGRHELGPKFGSVPIGGESQLEGSFEVRYPIFSIFGGAIFLDAGNVWLGSFQYHIRDLRYAAGVGLRMTTPFGPVRVDVARPVWGVEHKIQVHINVGQAF